MAKLKGGLQFQGTVGEVTAYKRYDMDEIILRAKGGASKEKIKTSDSCMKVRKNNAEFDGRAKLSGDINTILKQITAVNDFNYVGPLNGLLRPLQKVDTVNGHGLRSIRLSQDAGLLKGWSLSQRNAFESVLRTPVTAVVSGEQPTAIIELPAIMPGINFNGIGTFPVYRWIAVMGIVPDYYCDEVRGYVPVQQLSNAPFVTYYGDWKAVNENGDAETIELCYPEVVDRNNCTVLVAVGISFGLIKGLNNIVAVKGAGCGKIL